MSAAASRRSHSADPDNELGDNDSVTNEPFDELNFNSNNGNDLTDEDLPTPTICVYGSRGMAGPLDLDVRQNNELPGDSYCECNVTNYHVLWHFDVIAVRCFVVS